MKYQLEHETIQNYQPDIEKISLNNITSLQDHSIEHINLYNALELIQDPNTLLTTLLSKLRLKGVVVLVGIDLNKICELYLDKVLSYKEFNNLISNKTIYPMTEAIQILKANQFHINLIKTDRLLYHIECGRIHTNG